MKFMLIPRNENWPLIAGAGSPEILWKGCVACFRLDTLGLEKFAKKFAGDNLSLALSDVIFFFSQISQKYITGKR